MTRPFELDDLYSIRTPSDPQLSPDGETVAFVLTSADRDEDEDRSSIWTIPVSGGEPAQLTQGSHDSAPRWSPDGRLLAFVSVRGDDAKPQIFVLPAEGGEARALTNLSLGAGDPVWAPDGSKLAFTAAVDIWHPEEDDAAGAESEPIVITRLAHKADGIGRLKGFRQHLFVVDAGGGEVRRLTYGDFFASTPVWAPDGEQLAFGASMTDDRDLTYASAVYVVGTDGDQIERITAEDGAFGVAAWAPDGASLLLTGRDSVIDGHTLLYSVPLAGEGPRPLTTGFDRNVMVGAPGYPGAMPRFVGDGRTVLFCARERGRVHVLSVPAGGGTPELVVGGDRVVAGLTEADGTIAFVAASADSPGELYVRTSDGDVSRITELFAASLPDVQLIEPEERLFTAPDGTTIEGWVLRGDASGPTPLLLDIHGGPHNAWGPAFDPVHPYQQTLAARGWTILYVNPRGSDGYGEEFWRGLHDDGWGRADEQDFVAAVDALVLEGLVDPGRVAVTGYSYGGAMTCWLTARTDLFAAAVAGGSVSNLVSMSGTSDVGWLIRSIELGRNSYDDASLVELSPITYAADVDTPTLVLHGANDDRCPPGQAEEWFTALRSRRVPSELVLYPGASHLFVLSGKPSHRIDYCTRLQEWVVRHAEGGRTRAARGLPRGLEARLEKAIARHRVPGAAIAVLRGDELVDAAAGVINVNTGIRARTDSVFQIGSITKSYTATLVLQLVDEGALDLDAPIVEVLDEFKVADPDVTKRVTMRHLLSHTSGIQGDHFPDTGRGDECVERFVATCADLGQNHPLGATMSYCNTGYVVAGRVIEKITGLSWDEALRTRLFEPLGLTHSVTLPEEAMRFRTAFGHVVEPGKDVALAPQWVLPRSCGPAGLICATVADVVAFARMHLDEGRAPDGKQVLSPASVKAMQIEQVEVPDPYTVGAHWGLGWMLFDWDGRRLFGHDGNTIGQSAFLRILPDEDLAISLLTNGGNTQDLFRDLVGGLFEELAGVRIPPMPAPLARPERIDFARYVGTYERISTRVEVVERDGELVAFSTVTGPLAELVPKATEEHVLHPAGPDLFVLRDEGQATWTPMVFFNLEDGTRCIHTGARATPLVSA